MSILTDSITGGTGPSDNTAVNKPTYYSDGTKSGSQFEVLNTALKPDAGYDWSGAWKGFKKGMVSKYGEKAAHGLSDVALGASEGKVNEATGYMSTGSVPSAMAKGAISGAIGSGGNPFAAMAGAGIAGITASLQNQEIRKRNQQLKLSRDATIKSDTEMSKASLAGKTGERKAAAMRGLGQTMSQALLG